MTLMFRIYYYSYHILAMNKLMEGDHWFLENRTLIILSINNIEKFTKSGIDYFGF